MYPYLGIMKGISDNEQVPRGKRTNQLSLDKRKSNVEIGQKDWKNEYESVTNYFYKPQPFDPNVNTQKGKSQASTFQIAQDPKFDREAHFKTETMKQFTAPVSTQMTKGTKDKTALFQTNYSLGDDRVSYETTSKRLFTDKSKEKTDSLPMKPRPEKYNIITNQELPTNLKQKSNVFDYWNPSQTKNHITNNVTDYPIPGRKVDIITGRVLPTSKYVPYQ
mgnify:CR=1 FL=1